MSKNKSETKISVACKIVAGNPDIKADEIMKRMKVSQAYAYYLISDAKRRLSGKPSKDSVKKSRKGGTLSTDRPRMRMQTTEDKSWTSRLETLSIKDARTLYNELKKYFG